LSNQLRLDVAQLTDVGRKRPHNEDHMAHVIPKDPQTLSKKGALFVVADGMGGHAAGEIASEIAVETISVVYYQDDSEDVGTSLVHAIKRANTLIHQRAAENMLRSGMGTTCVAAVLRGGAAYIANVGDSRLYLVRGNQVQQISQDHSWVAEQVRAKLLTEEQARSHAQRNVITRCLGTQTDVEVDLFIEPLEAGDALVLCSDGLSGLIEEDELLNIVNQYVPQESVYHLIERANEHGGTDNITAIVVRVQEVGWEPTPVLRNGHGNGSNGHGEQPVDAIAAMRTLGLPQYPASGRSNEPFRISSGPLSNEDFAQFTPQPARKRRRLLYPTLIVSLLLLVALVGSGIFYLFHLNTVDVNGTLTKAQGLINEANIESAGNNSTLALKNLAEAQRELQSIKGSSSLTSTQSNRLNTLLNTDLTSAVTNAVKSYNQQNRIATASSNNLNVTQNAVTSGNAGINVASIVTVEDAKTSATWFYVLGANSMLYQLNADKSLGNPPVKWSPANTQVVTLASDGSRLLALTQVPAQANASPTYSLNVLTPTSNGALDISSSQKIPPSPANVPLQTPTLLTAWGSDVYVALSSTTSQMTIDHYTITNNKLTATPDYAMLSLSTSLESMAAFPGKQLFFLFKGGIVASMMFAPGNQTYASVSVQPSVSQPLPIEASNFTASTPIPTLVAQPTATNSTTFLNIPNATLLVAGSVNEISYLFIVDSIDHRVLSLKNAIVVPNATVTTASGSGGTSSSSSVTLQLYAQYIDTNFSPIVGIVTDPKVPQIYVLTSDTNQMATLFTLHPN